MWLGLVVKGWHDDSEKLDEVEQEYAVYRTGIETAAKVRKEVSDGFQSEIATLRANQRPAPTVRLCQSPGSVPASGPAGGNNGSSPSGWQLPKADERDHQEGPDIGTDLFGLADRADELSAQLRACQSFVGKLQAAAPAR